MGKFARLITIALFYCLYSYSPLSYSQTIAAGFEPFPPLINEDGSGLVLDMLKVLTVEQDLHFNVTVMNYARAKHDLKGEKLKLIGLTPFQLETKKFYQYGLELEWHINTRVDFFALERKYFSIEQLPDGSIGTLLGNADFFAEIINVPTTKFVEVTDLEQLVKMLALGRLKVILFERASTMSTINALNIDNIYYKNMGIVPASLAVPNTEEGIKLKAQLDNLLQNVDNNKFFSEFINYTSMEHTGQVINK